MERVVFVPGREKSEQLRLLLAASFGVVALGFIALVADTFGLIPSALESVGLQRDGILLAVAEGLMMGSIAGGSFAFFWLSSLKRSATLDSLKILAKAIDSEPTGVAGNHSRYGELRSLEWSSVKECRVWIDSRRRARRIRLKDGVGNRLTFAGLEDMNGFCEAIRARLSEGVGVKVVRSHEILGVPWSLGVGIPAFCILLQTCASVYGQRHAVPIASISEIVVTLARFWAIFAFFLLVEGVATRVWRPLCLYPFLGIWLRVDRPRLRKWASLEIRCAALLGLVAVLHLAVLLTI